MCTGVEPALIAAYVGAGAAVAGAVTSYEQGKDAKAEAKFQREKADADRLKAETDAAQRASAQTMMARRALAKNSLFTGGGTTGQAQKTLGVG